jgi:replication initiator protein RepSA
MLGFRGHFVTKSRAYSTTLGELHDTRAKWRAERAEQPAYDDDSTPVLATWQYNGSGYLNPRRHAPGGRRRGLRPRRRDALVDLGRRPPDHG